MFGTNSIRPRGFIEHDERNWQVQVSDQLRRAEEYLPLIIRYRDGAPVRLRDVATVTDSVENRYSSGFHNDRPAVLLMIRRQPAANIIATIDAINAQLPGLRALLPADADLTLVMDRSPGIRATLHEARFTLLLAAGLVMLVVLAFLGSARAALIPSLAIPVSLIGTFAIMYLYGFSLNNLSLMALIVAAGLVVDDAIVVLENISRHIERGLLAHARGHAWSRRGRVHPARDEPFAGDGVHLDSVHGRSRRAAVSRVFHHARRGNAGFARGVAHADAQPLLPLAQTAQRNLER